MRALSPHAKYSIQLFEADTRRAPNERGAVVEWEAAPAVNAHFQVQGLAVWEAEAVLTMFNFSGLPEGVNPLTTIGVFDPEGYVHKNHPQWSEEDRNKEIDRLEERLRGLAELFPSQFICVDKPASPKPWPTYDQDSVADILAIRERLEISPQVVRLYELENQKRDEVVEAMLALTAEVVPDEADIVVSV